MLFCSDSFKHAHRISCCIALFVACYCFYRNCCAHVNSVEPAHESVVFCYDDHELSDLSTTGNLILCITVTQDAGLHSESVSQSVTSTTNETNRTI